MNEASTAIPNNVTHLPSYQRSTRPTERPYQRSQGPQQGGARRYVAKGHDSQLQEAQYGKLPVEIVTTGDIVYSGTISRRDKFTITLRIASIGGSVANAGKDVIIYKHAIESVMIDKGVMAQGETGPEGQ